MASCVGLNRGSLISARNLCLSLISPSHSVFTKRLETSASNAAASRFTWASFQRRSRTRILLSRGSACCAAIPTEPAARRRQQRIDRIMQVHARRHPYVRQAFIDNTSALFGDAMEKHEGELRTSWQTGRPALGLWPSDLKARTLSKG